MFAILLTLVSNGFASVDNDTDTGVIQVQVVDEDGAPVAADLRIARHDLQDSTGATVAVDAGRHGILVEAEGFDHVRATAIVDPGETEHVTVVMRAPKVRVVGDSIVVRGGVQLGSEIEGDAMRTLDRIARLIRDDRTESYGIVVVEGADAERVAAWLRVTGVKPHRLQVGSLEGDVRFSLRR